VGAPFDLLVLFYGVRRPSVQRSESPAFSQADSPFGESHTEAIESPNAETYHANGQTDLEPHEAYGESHAQAKRVTDDVSYTQADGSESRAFSQADGPFGESHAEANESPNAETHHADRAAHWSTEHESDGAADGAAVGAAHRTAFRGAYHS